MYFKFSTLMLRMLSRYFVQQTGVAFEGSAASPVQSYTAIWPGSRCSVMFLRLVMQDATRAVFRVYPEVRTKVYVDDTKVQGANRNGQRSDTRSQNKVHRIAEANEHEKFEVIIHFFFTNE